jgi:hypothetical protein
MFDQKRKVGFIPTFLVNENYNLNVILLVIAEN